MQPPPRLPRKTNWVQRNWKWMVPVLLLVFAGIIAAFVAVVCHFMKSSGAYTEAIAIVRNDPAVIAALGEPIQEGFFLTGNITTSGPTGRANLSAPIRGSKDNATLYIRAIKKDGQWQFQRLVLEVSGTGNRIELTAQPPVPGKPKP